MKINLFLKENIKVIVAFILGLLITGISVFVETAAASDIPCSPPSGSELSSNVQSAISELYSNSNTMLPSLNSVCLDLGQKWYYNETGHYTSHSKYVTTVENDSPGG